MQAAAAAKKVSRAAACRTCGSTETRAQSQIFRDGTQHVRIVCGGCHTYLRFAGRAEKRRLAAEVQGLHESDVDQVLILLDKLPPSADFVATQIHLAQTRGLDLPDLVASAKTRKVLYAALRALTRLSDALPVFGE